jgi:hypothetical protein
MNSVRRIRPKPPPMRCSLNLQQRAPGVNGNLYLMPDQRLLAANTPLYDPVVLTDTPQTFFADWPERKNHVSAKH